MELKRTNLNDKITDTIDDFNDNWEAIEEEVGKKADGLLVKNEIVNGDFSDGISGFVAQAGVEYEVVNNELHITKFGNAFNVFSLGPKAVSGDYYVKATVKGEAGKAKIVKFGTTVSDNLSTDDWEFLSIRTSLENLNRVRIMELTDGNLRGTTPSEPYKIKEVIAINLTQTFGAGNEPTKEEMDLLISQIGYIDGEITLTQTQLLNWNLELNRLKANKQQEAWITPTLLNGWKTGLRGVWFYKDNLGLVHIQGSVATESFIPNSVIFQLPIGYRPSTTLVFNGVRVDLPDVVFYVYTNGNVTLIKPSNLEVGSKITWLSLSQIHFRVV